MFNLKTIKALKERVEELEDDTSMLFGACDALADNAGKIITNCDCCGDICLEDK